MVEYTYEWYKQFLRKLVSAGHTFKTYDDSLASGDLLLRHDVDWSPRKALEIAGLEHEVGVSSTFFFMITNVYYNPLNRMVREQMSRIEDLGHDIGLHFSTHQYWDGEPEVNALVETIRTEQEILATAVEDPIDTVAFHNPPEWTLERNFEGFESTYEPRFFKDIGYYADSLGRWRETPPSIADSKEPAQILTHPALWGEVDGSAQERIHEEQLHLLRLTDRYMHEGSTLPWTKLTDVPDSYSERKET